MARSAAAFLALAAAAASTALAQVPFNKGDCTQNPPSDVDVTLSANGQWSCGNFALGGGQNFVTVLKVPPALDGVRLQIYFWNQGLGGTAGEAFWSQGATNFLRIVSSRNDQKDTNGLGSTFSSPRYPAASDPVPLNYLPGWTGGLKNDGVYAYYGETSLCTGNSFLYATHPGGSGSFQGMFLYRFVAAGATGPAATIVPSSSVDVTAASLAEGGSVLVSNWMSPGSSITVSVDDEYVSAGYALEGFEWNMQVDITGPGTVGNSELDWELPLPNGYTAWAHADKSYNNSGGVGDLTTADGQALYYDYSPPSNNIPPFGPASPDVTFGNNNLVSRKWNVPLDVAATPGAGFGQLVLTLPVIQNFTGSLNNPYSWFGQDSPFWNVNVTLVRVERYPMLTTLSDLELRNFDTNTVLGHSVQDTRNQKPFAIFRVKSQSPLWWRFGVELSGVTTKNSPTAPPTETYKDAPRPNVEVQVVSDWSGRRANGWGAVGWTNNNNQGPQQAGYEMEQFSGTEAGTSWAWMVNQYWRQGGANEHLMSTLPPLRPVGSLWFLVRISATRAVDATGTPSTCSSDWISITSASATFDSVADQCSDYLACTADANPNAGQTGLSANANARRFSTCVLREVAGTSEAGTSGKAIPATKCVECRTDDHCAGGQYCHLDDGLCGGGTYCDAASAPLFGLCRTKSPDVLGKQCRPNLVTTDSGSPPVSVSASTVVAYPGATNDNSVIGTPQQVSGVPRGPNELFVVQGTAGTNFTATGGYCGEFLYAPRVTVGGYVATPQRVRATLWEGFCSHEQVCLECEPGASALATKNYNGKVCRNGYLVTAGDPIAQGVGEKVQVPVNPGGGGGGHGGNGTSGDGGGSSNSASGEASTSDEAARADDLLAALLAILIIGLAILLLMAALFMYSSAQRYRKSAGLASLSCLEVLCCCGVCSESSPGAARRRTVSGAASKTRAKSLSTASPLAAATSVEMQASSDTSRAERVAGASQPSQA